jgi:protein TonB
VSQSDVTYLRPPAIVYPAMSRRLNETGNVIVAVYFDVGGVPKRAEILKSSGYERLDRAAQAAMMGARVTPFRRPGMSDSHVFMLRAPINFVLE